jgi:hypothetical protein
MYNDWDKQTHKALFGEEPATTQEMNQDIFNSLGITNDDIQEILWCADVNGLCGILDGSPSVSIADTGTYRLGAVHYTPNVAYAELPDNKFLVIPYSV